MAIKLKLITLLLSNAIINTYQQQVDSSSSDVDDDDDDECAFISGQHCDQNGICKYCAMCLQSSCILSKTIGGNTNSINSCNTTQFGTTNLYNWYDYCLSSDNDNSGDYCATSTECYQYRKSAGPSVTYAWHNLTCNPNTCMLIASNGAPPPIPVPPQSIGNNGGTQSPIDPYNKTPNSDDNTFNASEADARHRYYHNKFHNPAAIALTVVCCLVLLVAICWMLRLCKKKGWWPFTKNRLLVTAAATGKRRDRSQQEPSGSHDSISSAPSSAPPSFSSTPPDMAMIRHPHLHLYTHQPSIPSGRSSTASSSNNESLPSYLSPYLSPPKYEQAIVTQIRGLREEGSSSGSNRSSLSNTDQYHRNNTAPLPSMWVPVYFTQQHQPNFGRGRAPNNQVELYGFTPNPVFWAPN
ncbi:hypothetical protein HMPREF1544_11762 [Mucor circinelloides 1006PhL]|uniref:Uncharacterized protein n=1 Tax=Mucor circinelloides f. circinelloides (strain 1006PhL) TaxID=1220926 RepID=S2IW28_MUCC1|nr:hypothetical protein HMPREF1544_11762 [Mucor circinelloides 1006PhL]